MVGLPPEAREVSARSETATGPAHAAPKPGLAWWKLIAVWAGFLGLHFSYETFPNTLFKLIGEEGETTFFHMKMLFFAYIFVTLAEYVWRRKSIADAGSFATWRALIAVAYPWLTITVWFTAEALGIAWPGLAIELVYANVITVLGIYLALRLEQALDDVRPRPALTGVVWLVFACALLSYAAFSFTELMPFFVEPPGF